MGWLAPYSKAGLDAYVELPGSKSVAARALVLALLADGDSELTGVPDGRDTQLLLAAIQGFGATLTRTAADTYLIHPPEVLVPARVEVGLSGTVLRFLPPVAALIAGTSSFFGDPQAAARPIAGLLSALEQAGARVDSHTLPFQVSGPVSPRAREVRLDCSPSSQFCSGLLLAAARFPNGLRIVHTGGPIPSRPHLDMTLSMLASRGVQACEQDGRVWEVAPSSIASSSERIEPDLTNTVTFLAAALVCGGVVKAPWPTAPVQPGAELLDVLLAFGAKAEITDDQVSVIGTGELAPVDLDLSQISEITPVAAALAALANGTSRLRGIGHISGHETDRLAALATELSALGCPTYVETDALVIRGAQPRAGVFHTYADHRMAHAGALLGLRTPGVSLNDVSCTAKTLPQFTVLWENLVGAR